VVVLLVVVVHVHVYVLVDDWRMLPMIVGRGLKMVPVVLRQLVLEMLVLAGGRLLMPLVLVRKGLPVLVVLVVVVLLQLLVLNGGHTLLLVGGGLQLLVLVLVLLLVCGKL
jgi:hypothetical protein